MLSNRMRIQKTAFTNKKPRMPYFNAQKDQRKTIKVIKVLLVKCPPVANKDIKQHSNRYSRLLDRKHVK